jgi:hypothetical protein
MKYHNKQNNMICFDSADLAKFFEIPGKSKLRNAIIANGYLPEEIITDTSKIEKIISSVKLIEDKEDIEIFAALYLFLKFYPGAKICFLLKNDVDPKKEAIDSLEKLKSSLKENDLTDFGFMTTDGIRAFQLKQYKGKTLVIDLLDFIEKKLLHYANDLGEVNLLIILQSDGPITGSFFQDIHKYLMGLKIKGTGHILISYNEANKFSVINTVYPSLGTTRIPRKRFASQVD